MPSLVTRGDRIVTLSGRESWLARPSVPFNTYADSGFVRLLGEAGTLSFSELYRTQPWVKVCVDKLAHQIATLPLKVYKVDSQNGRERVTAGALPDLLAKPWPRARPVHLKQKIAFPALLHGNSLLGKVRENGPASPTRRLRPLDWRYLSPVCDNGDLLAWKYTQRGTDYISPDETVHFFWESPDGVSGTSPLVPLGITIANERAAQDYSADNFSNGVNPSVAITLAEGAKNDDETRRAIREGVMAVHGGKPGLPIVVGGGASIEALSHTAKEAELIEVRKLNREEVAAVYDIPPPMIGILDKATYSNINEQHKMLYMTVLRPWLTLIEETFEAHLIDGEPAFEGLHLEFDLGEVLKGDAKERADAFKVFLEAGVYTINELRKMENMPPVNHPLANQPLIPANNLQPIDKVGADPAPPPPANTPVAPVLASHLARAADRVTRGNDLDAKRFIRELEADLRPHLGDSAEPFAGVWGAAVEAGVVDANGSRENVEQFFTSLGAS